MRRVSILAIVGAMTLSALAAPALGGVTSAQVEQAIREGVLSLRSAQNAEGQFGGPRSTDLVVLALLTAGVPVDDPAIAKAMDWSLRQDPELKNAETHDVALQTMALAAGDPAGYREPIRRNVAWLERLQWQRAADPKSAVDEGAWTYSTGTRKNHDNSNTQFAILAPDAAEAGVAVSDEAWRAARRHWESCQLPDGGWSYAEFRKRPTSPLAMGGDR